MWFVCAATKILLEAIQFSLCDELGRALRKGLLKIISVGLSDLLQQAKLALDAIGSPSQGAAANAWLLDFEGSPHSWDVAMMLMMEPVGSQKRFHGANILYRKIRQDFSQIEMK